MSIETLDGILDVQLTRAHGLRKRDIGSSSDPYAILYFNEREICKTQIIKDNNDPEWSYNTHVRIFGQVDPSSDCFKVDVFDRDLGNQHHDDYLGSAIIPWSRLARSQDNTVGIQFVGLVSLVDLPGLWVQDDTGSESMEGSSREKHHRRKHRRGFKQRARNVKDAKDGMATTGDLEFEQEMSVEDFVKSLPKCSGDVTVSLIYQPGPISGSIRSVDVGQRSGGDSNAPFFQ